MADLILQNGTRYQGRSFGFDAFVTGEVVFTTGMVGYPESLTDPSYRGQILIFTYPLIGNYGVPDSSTWESGQIQVAGVIVANYIDTPSHWTSQKTLAQWLTEEKIPALELPHTRKLTHHIRDQGSVLGKIECGTNDSAQAQSGGRDSWPDPNLTNLVAEVSVKKPLLIGSGKKKILLIDCGAKRNIERLLLQFGCQILKIPWDYPLAQAKAHFAMDGVIVSNGPGDPKMAAKTIDTLKQAMEQNLPILGICLGNQLLALAAGGDTRKLKFGHRGQNQPCQLVGTNRCFLTTQNHGYEVSRMPTGFEPWFINANDGSNEGIRHKTKPWKSVQFHPEACPGPTDTQWVLQEWVEQL